MNPRMVLRSAALVGASGMSYVYEPDVVPVISLGKIPGQTVLTRIFMLVVSATLASWPIGQATNG